MQRMKLYVSGVKPHKLGSIQDKVTREYMFKEAELEASRTEFTMLTSLASAEIEDPKTREKWSKTVNASWRKYLKNLFNLDIPETDEREEMLKEYYEKVISKTKPVLHIDKKTKGLSVTGLENLKL